MTRKQDVRLTEVDSVDVTKCFRPGDVVIAEIISLGDARTYYLSVARNDLGVVYATSTAGWLLASGHLSNVQATP